jgi:hypothetical protein
MSRSRFSCFVSMLVAVLLLFGTMLWAQRTSADLLGTVTDASGAVLPNVKVTAHNLDTAADFTGESDKSGDYAVTQLPVGRYSIKAVSPGFKTWAVPQVTLAIGDRLRQDVQLQLGTLEQSVEVTAASPALQTDSSSLGSLVSTQALQDLPLNGRNLSYWRNLLQAPPRAKQPGCPAGRVPMTAD